LEKPLKYTKKGHFDYQNDLFYSYWIMGSNQNMPLLALNADSKMAENKKWPLRYCKGQL